MVLQGVWCESPLLSIEKHIDLAEAEVPASVKIVIYRVMQEALANVARHSRATMFLSL